MLFILMLIVLLVIALLLAFERERKRRAKHRASTAALLRHIEWLPRSVGLDLNVAANWKG